MEKIIVGKRYVVTKASDDRTFNVGDHISMDAGGSINNHEAQGWIEACDVAEATKGMEAEIDKQWIERRKKKLLEELAALDTYQSPRTEGYASAHDWECISPGEYDSLYECRRCGARHMEQADRLGSDKPRFGCTYTADVTGLAPGKDFQNETNAYWRSVRVDRRVSRLRRQAA